VVASAGGKRQEHNWRTTPRTRPMTILTTRRLARTALIAALALPATALLPEAAPLAITKAQAAASTARTLAEFKAVLADYGTFGTHAKYGEIWVPTVTPQGWHPYPACQWVYTKNGWYFNDETPWGSIVHHHGRWSHDEKIGWFWIPDENWSPGWVVWRKSDQWIGWAPMPPTQEAQLVSSAEFNNDKFWIFMDAKPFFNGGCGATVQNVQTAPATQVFQQTKYVTIFDLAPGLLVDVVFVPYWDFWVISQLVVIVVDPLFCGPVILPFKHTEKPPEKPADKPTPISTDKPNPPGITRDPPSRPKPDITIDLPPRGKPDVTVNWPPRFNPGVVIVDPVRPGITGNPDRPGKGDGGKGGKGDGSKGNGSNGRGPTGPTGPTGSLGSTGPTGSLGSGHIPKKPILDRWPTKPTVNLGNATGGKPTINVNPGGMRPSLVRTSPNLVTNGRGSSALR
jgi:hypothetical protein